MMVGYETPDNASDLRPLALICTVCSRFVRAAMTVEHLTDLSLRIFAKYFCSMITLLKQVVSFSKESFYDAPVKNSLVALAAVDVKSVSN